MKKSALTALCVMICVWKAVSQGGLEMPQSSPKASVSQRIGLTDISIHYNSPSVKGRVIWGEVVPFGEVWRAGANENTVISFSTAVKIEGRELPAGTYGLHMIPGKNSWTIIFSGNSKSWGSYFYDPAEDVLRVEVVPEVTLMQEWLSYRFTDLKSSTAKVMLNWEKIGVGFLVQVDVPKTVIESMRQELRGNKYYNWESPAQAAEYCLKNKTNTEEAMKWVDHSISMKETFSNMNTKAGLLDLKGDSAGAKSARSRALMVADEQQLNSHGYQLLAEDKKKEAIEIFKLNVSRYPDSWNVYDSLADAYDQNGNNKEAITNYKIALSKAPDSQKKRINNMIEKIQKKT